MPIFSTRGFQSHYLSGDFNAFKCLLTSFKIAHRVPPVLSQLNDAFVLANVLLLLQIVNGRT